MARPSLVVGLKKQKMEAVREANNQEFWSRSGLIPAIALL